MEFNYHQLVTTNSEFMVIFLQMDIMHPMLNWGVIGVLDSLHTTGNWKHEFFFPKIVDLMYITYMSILNRFS